MAKYLLRTEQRVNFEDSRMNAIAKLPFGVRSFTAARIEVSISLSLYLLFIHKTLMHKSIRVYDMPFISTHGFDETTQRVFFPSAFKFFAGHLAIDLRAKMGSRIRVAAWRNILGTA